MNPYQASGDVSSLFGDSGKFFELKSRSCCKSGFIKGCVLPLWTVSSRSIPVSYYSESFWSLAVRFTNSEICSPTHSTTGTRSAGTTRCQ